MMLSIIIPVYKTESTLDRCMESIVRQEYQDWEAILVDDGSPDGCPAICDEWGRRDPRISVVHQKNGGLSAARNAGLERVRGEYITFVDSDDYLSPDVLQKLMLHLSAHPDYDILEYSMLRFDDHGEQPFLSLEEQVYDDGQAYWLGERAYLHTYACNKIFRKSLFGQVRFPEGKTFEDAHTLPHLLHHAATIATSSIGYYHYYRNEESITTQADGRAWQSLLEAQVNVLKDMMPLQSLKAEHYYMHVFNIQLYAYALGGEEPILPAAKIHHPLGMETMQQKTKALMLNMLGVKRCCKLYRMFYRVRR